MKRHARPVAAAALMLAAALPAPAQDYPRGPISLVIPLAPGDANDIVGRAVAEDLGRELKTQVVVVNRPGAGAALGTSVLVKSKNDGQTIGLINNAGLVFRPLLDPASAGYDTLKDLTPLALAIRSPSILVIRGDAPYKTFAELVEHAKKNPGAVRVGTAGVGSVGDFCVKVISSATGVDLTMVPYTGASPAVTALRGGHIEGIILALGTVTAHLTSGVMRGLLISTRYPDFPDIPTPADLGYRQPLFDVWSGFFAPANVPAEVTRALVPALERAIKSPPLAAKLQSLGIIADYAPPARALADIREERRRVEEIARQAGLAR